MGRLFPRVAARRPRCYYYYISIAIAGVYYTNEIVSRAYRYASLFFSCNFSPAAPRARIAGKMLRGTFIMNILINATQSAFVTSN